MENPDNYPPRHEHLLLQKRLVQDTIWHHFCALSLTLPLRYTLSKHPIKGVNMSSPSFRRNLMAILRIINNSSPTLYTDETMQRLVVTTEFQNSIKTIELGISTSSTNEITISFLIRHPNSDMCYDSGCSSKVDGEFIKRVKYCFNRAATNQPSTFKLAS